MVLGSMLANKNAKFKVAKCTARTDLLAPAVPPFRTTLWQRADCVAPCGHIITGRDGNFPPPADFALCFKKRPAMSAFPPPADRHDRPPETRSQAPHHFGTA